MYDMNGSKADDMNYDLMAERTRYFFKENPEGVREVSAIMEEMCDEAAYFKSIEIAGRMIRGNQMDLEEIAEYTGLTLDKIMELAAQKKLE